MPRDPVQQDGVWWLQQDDGSWIRWDETSGRWVDTKGAVVGVAPPATAGVAAPTYATPPASPTPSGAQKPRGKGPIYAIVGVVAVAVVAIAAFAIASGGGGDGDDESTLGGTQGAAPAQAALDPIACEHTGSGKAYEVGPGKALDSLGKVPWETLAAGDTVRIHWRAEPYREKFFLRGQGHQGPADRGLRRRRPERRAAHHRRPERGHAARAADAVLRGRRAARADPRHRSAPPTRGATSRSTS